MIQTGYVSHPTGEESGENEKHIYLVNAFLCILGHSKVKQKPHQQLLKENILYLSWRRWRLKAEDRTESPQVLSQEGKTTYLII